MQLSYQIKLSWETVFYRGVKNLELFRFDFRLSGKRYKLSGEGLGEFQPAVFLAQESALPVIRAVITVDYGVFSADNKLQFEDA